MSSLAKAALQVVLFFFTSVSVWLIYIYIYFKNDTTSVYEYGRENFQPTVNVFSLLRFSLKFCVGLLE